MIVMLTVFWIGVVAVGVMLFRGQNSDSATARRLRTLDRSRGRDPMDILNDRLARGELEREEYEARKSVLHGDRGTYGHLWPDRDDSSRAAIAAVYRSRG